ncbi:MAG: PadR family transcriptional regulator [Isosphaeraceae bacterium]
MDSQFLGSAVEMLILEIATQGPTYGYEVAQTVAERSGGYFELKEGSLYPALHRLERQKLLRSFWREADGRRRKYYEATEAGKRELAARKRTWLNFTAGINGVLGSGRSGLAGFGHS